MAYNSIMIFIETSIFTKEIQRLISDDNYRMLQTALMLRPDAGSLIRGSGGLRKIRWNLPGKGKEVHCGSFITGILLTLFLCFFHTGRLNKKI
jgi:hypothetical protein